ncbi:MAG: Nitrogenase (molybdenum-iron)-specific transcriptional regulator NifA [Myxococcaceae bacterium]|nr:Nitrogenase (molybdenum-iron)-specific transcriptional regulator NifA [Myxococcaceae bacterium]
MSSVRPEGDDPIETRASSAGAGSSVGIVVTVLSGQSKGVTRPLSGRLRIGKANDNDLVLTDDTVSRHHCELQRTGEGIHVKDLGSTNGTKVEGARVQEATFPAGTVLRVGEVEISLRPQPQRIEVLPSDRTRFGPAIGHSIAMRTIFALLERIAPTEATVLFSGETGTGKDVLARAVVDASPRATKPFVVVDCGAVSYSLLESELFGHERGAFTGAVATRQGAFELAEGGTVFLDEIGELPLDVQPKLLRVLETREFRRVGGNRTFRCDVRVIAATNRDLPREDAAGKFREDRYYRLAVVPVLVPPLRARRDDIEPLVEHILKSTGAADVALAKETTEALAAHDWPGNVRELRNVLERALYMTRATGAKELNALSFPLGAGGALGAPAVPSPSTPPGAEVAYDFDPQRSYRDTRAKYDADFETRYVKWLLGRHSGNVSAAAREAKMDRKHLHDMAKKHALRGNEE